VAAFLIDNGRAGVPETHFLENVKNSAMSKGDISKSGSLQKFVENVGDISSMGSSRFSISDVHNIGILDLRIFNMDRNSENILVKKTSEGFRLVPIDHTYCLPPTLESPWFEWQFWRQTKEPFSEEFLKFIREIDVEKDADILRSVGIEEESIRTMKISTYCLKIGAEFGLNLFEISSMVCRKKNQPSELEELVKRAEEQKGNFMEELVKVAKEAVAKKKAH